MAESFKLQAIITAVDNLSPTLKNLAKGINRFRWQLHSSGSGGLQMAAGLTAAVLGPAKAFSDLENAGTQLQNTLMRAGGGVPKTFETISKQAIELGNLLPGSTADFYAMASSLNALGASAETISGGALKATAYLGVVGKPLGVTYEQAAESIGKLSNALGIAAGDLVPFADTLQRTLHMGIDLQQMQYSMSRVAGVLKPLGKQGLEAANELVPLNALLIQSGVSGEEAGTGLKKMISVMASQGKFKGIPEMVKSLEKLGKLDGAKQIEMFEKLFGKEHAGKAMIIAAGGYDKLVKSMAEQASMQERVNNSLGTLTNLWEAATGTATNAAAAIATAYSPELKQAARGINDAAQSVMEWAERNKGMIKTVLAATAGLTGLKLGFLGAAGALGVLNTVLKASPLGLFLSAMAMAVPAIMENWDKVVPYFENLFSNLRKLFTEQSEIVSGIVKALTPDTLIDFFKSVPSSNGMRPPGYSDTQKALAGSNSSSVKGSIDVNFNNTPPGTRVVPAEGGGGVVITPNVGYRSLGTAAP